MISCQNWPIGVCSWSLRNDTEVLKKIMNISGMMHLHLSLDPVLTENNTNYLKTIEKNQWELTASMISFPQEDYSTLESIKKTGGIIPDKHWESNKKKILSAIDLTNNLGLKFLTFHLGFIDRTNQELRDRIRLVADSALQKNVMILMETGQESAETLREFLEELSHPALAVNFDPANMILYGLDDPIESLIKLSPWVKHVHIKDAIKSNVKGQWGKEVPWDEGDLNNYEFLKTLELIGFKGSLAIEREAGSNRLNDIQKAANRLQQFSN